MNMRIDGQTQPTDAEAARRLESAHTAERPSGPGATGPASTGDRVEVSSDLQLVAAAIAAAAQSPDVRPDAVARGREALASGALGRDAEGLADRLIDALVDRGLSE